MRASPPIFLHRHCRHQIPFPPDRSCRKQGLAALAFHPFHLKHSHFTEAKWIHQRSLQLGMWEVCCKQLSQRICSWSSLLHLSCPLVLTSSAVHPFIVSPGAWRHLQYPGRRGNQAWQKILPKKPPKLAPSCGYFILSRTLTCYVIIAGYAGQEGCFFKNFDFYESLVA